MKTIKLTTLGLSLVVVTMSLGATSAQAGCSKGFIADVLCQAGVLPKPMARAADAFHAGVGRPLDRMAPAMGGAVAGPVGVGIGTAWQQQDQLRRQAAQPRRFTNAGPAYGDAQPMYDVRQGYGAPQGMESGAQMGNRCYTAYGLSGPGNFMPVGSSCSTQFGGQWVAGYVVSVGY